MASGKTFRQPLKTTAAVNRLALKRVDAHITHGAKTGNFRISDRFALELYCKDGTTIWAESSASSILDENGNPVGISGVARDIAERKKRQII
jgi:PAS domain S-box-containing protein